MIDGNISDLFFNTDCDDAKVIEGGKFVRFDEDKLRESAVMFLGCLNRLGVQFLPTPRALVADFLRRV